MCSSDLEAGPVELMNDKARVTIALMNDHSISERKFNKSGVMLGEMSYPVSGKQDLDSGIKALMSKVQNLKSEGYTEASSPALSKGKAMTQTKNLAGRKRATAEETKKPSKAPAKEEEKKAGGAKHKAKAAEKTSKRIAAKEKVCYDEKAIDKIIDEAAGIKASGSGCISVMLAQNYDPEKHDPTGWLMSEKLDGVRCYWNGTTMYSRAGNPFYAPPEFKAKLPKMAIDGELWTSRDDFQKIVSIVRKHEPEKEEWAKIKFMIFDAPLVKGNFSTRVKVCKAAIDAMPETVCEVLSQTKCTSKDELGTLMDSILSEKGEGVMLKDPKSAYEGRRSYSLLKVKRFEDTEAKVIGHLRGTGRCSNMLGALQVREKDGTEFKIGSGFNDAQRRSPPKIGSTVTFKFQGRSKKGIPRFPIFQRLHPGM